MSGNKKKIIRVVLLLFVSIKLFGQDTILFRNGDKQIVKVKEIGSYEIKYHRFNNLDGPVFISSVNEIKKIKYKAGNVDTFALKVIPEQGREPQSIATANAAPQAGRLSLYNKIKFSYKGMPLSKTELEVLLESFPNKAIREQLVAKYQEAEKYKQLSGLAIGLGFGIGFPLPVVTSFAAVSMSFGAYTAADETRIWGLFFGGIIAGAAIRITGSVYQKVYKNKHRNANEELVALYNKNI